MVNYTYKSQGTPKNGQSSRSYSFFDIGILYVLVPSCTLHCLSLRQHGIRHLLEARGIGAQLEVSRRAEILGRIPNERVDVHHNVLQPLVHLLAAPFHALRVLRHLEPAHRHSARVARLGRNEHLTLLLEHLDCRGRRWHIGALGHVLTPCLHQRRRVRLVNLILSRARQRHVHLSNVLPRLLLLHELGRLRFVLLNPTAPGFDRAHLRKLLLRESALLNHTATSTLAMCFHG